MSGLEATVTTLYFEYYNDKKYPEFSKFIDVVVKQKYGRCATLEDSKATAVKVAEILKGKSIEVIVNVLDGLQIMAKKARYFEPFHLILENLHLEIPNEYMNKYLDGENADYICERNTPLLARSVLEYNLFKHKNTTVDESEIVKLQQKIDEQQKIIDEFNKKLTTMKNLIEPK